MRAIVVEDEEKGMEVLVLKLKKHCPEVEVIAQCETGESAVLAIRDMRPDLVFLDIQLGTMTGFDVLHKVQQIPFYIIFTTQYEEYAIKAIKANALDYILKPVRPAELKQAVDVAAERIRTSQQVTRIVITSGNGYLVMHTSEIMYCLADDVNTHFHREGKRPFLAVKTLKSVYAMLPRDTFCRISRKAVVNLDYVESFHRADGGYVVMKDGKKLSVTRTRLDDFLRKLGSRF